MRHRVSRVTTISLITLLLMPGSVWSWGSIGHQVSASLAEARLTPAALAAVRSLLGPRQSLADIANWADEQREVTRSAHWHYVDVPISAPRYDPRYCPPDGCIVSKIEDLRRVLLDPRAARAKKQQALKFLVHFIQDVHQPLHVGDTGSRGGNTVQVRFFGLGTNLHQVWDFRIIEWHSRDEATWLRELNVLATNEMTAEWSKGTVEDWANESLALARLAYRLPGTGTLIKSGTKLGEEYCWFALPIVQRRLAQAGVRLAWTLNEIFK